LRAAAHQKSSTNYMILEQCSGTSSRSELTLR
jgi:hypothetical protein